MLPAGREWDVPLLQSLLYHHDVNEVLKIRLSDRVQEDHVAWMLEKTGIFSVKSAYRLVARLEAEEQNQTSCSSHTDGSRPMFRVIWKATVPPKVKNFAWRLSLEDIAT
jgi:hypothetical protein